MHKTIFQSFTDTGHTLSYFARLEPQKILRNLSVHIGQLLAYSIIISRTCFEWQNLL